MAKARNIPYWLKRQIWGSPCAVCGLSGRSVVDHILPVAKGGTCNPLNLQALCECCNGKKGDRLSNDELKMWHAKRRIRHFLNHHYALSRRYLNFYDGPGFHQWMFDWMFGGGRA
jgi:hypothetical protein